MSQVLRPMPNAVLRDGSRDGHLVHLPRSEEPKTLTNGTGEIYKATAEWEGSLRVYRMVVGPGGVQTHRPKNHAIDESG